MTSQDELTRRRSWERLLLRAASDISLTPSQYTTIEDRYSQLQKILDASTNPLLSGAHIFPQGSMRLKTTINPVGGAPKDLGTIDADAIIWLPHAAQADAMTVLNAIEERFRDGSRVKSDIVQLRRGIRIEYADVNPGFHIDVTPARAVWGNSKVDGQGKLEVPDREIGWKASSPISYADWLNDASQQHISLEQHLYKAVAANRSVNEAMDAATQEPLPTYQDYDSLDPLRATIKLLKRHRDEWAIETRRKDYRPISAVITTLATHAYLKVVEESKLAPLTPIDAILQIVEKMRDYVRHINGEYQVLNPKDAGENFSEKWNRPDEGPKYRRAFYDWHASAAVSFQLGLQSHESADTFAQAMAASFGIDQKTISDVNREIPGHWTMPGRKVGMTRNAVSLGALSGSASHASTQSNVKPVERLG
ncbi:nucleotidyltransferase domain-containing protein [Pseudomonas sichuanensis]|uniref:nucleotidyltransferase domain-containing protein n=3 Tax=Pseudomonas sichuanensis TaxID=2213015 RepID=UPI00244987FD|nr:nucleotidyltransferase [Pseudomonas sichuanensis]MDH0729221.1 nucleotidyltransferase [Pseudomonas sichuanensis]